jgi:hypothetical protein
MERGRCKWYWDEYGERRLGWRPGRIERPAGRFRQTGWAKPINGWRYYFSSRCRNRQRQRCAEHAGATWSRLSAADRPDRPCWRIITLKNRLFASVFFAKDFMQDCSILFAGSRAGIAGGRDGWVKRSALEPMPQ